MPLRDITFRNVSLSATHGADLAYADGIVFEHVSIHPSEERRRQDHPGAPTPKLRAHPLSRFVP